jgi:hypothetical protein
VLICIVIDLGMCISGELREGILGLDRSHRGLWRGMMDDWVGQYSNRVLMMYNVYNVLRRSWTTVIPRTNAPDS